MKEKVLFASRVIFVAIVCPIGLPNVNDNFPKALYVQ